MSETKVPSEKSAAPPAPECGYYLNTIYFYLTEGCNLRCRHCWINPPYEGGAEMKAPCLPLDLFKDIVRQARPLGMNSIKLTGGEPLIHPEIEAILDFIQGEKLGLTLETNGVKLTPPLVDKILANPRRFISVSIDGVDPATHDWVRGVEGSFEQALEGVRLLVRTGYRPQLIMSVMKHNAGQMEAVVRLAEREGCASVKFNLVTPVARGERLAETGHTLSIGELVRFGEWVERELVPGSKIRVVYSHPAAFQPLHRLLGAERSRCGIFGILGVLGNGKYALCGIGTTVPELVFGDARADRLADVWNRNPILQELRRGLPAELKGICADCLNRTFCLASCVANNYYRHRDLLAPFWYCEEAFQAGVFPTTRLRPGSPSLP